MTHGQPTRLRALLDEVNAICGAAAAEETTWDAARMCYMDEPTKTDTRQVAPSLASAAARVESDPHAPKEQPTVYSLDLRRYADVGLVMDNGVVTYALGDEHARAIVAGHHHL